ncbi:MAG: hypothetical protein ACE5OQ_07475 [Woeseia sp.]
MKHSKVLIVAATAALACSGAAVAGPQWTFAEVGLATGDGDEVNDTKFIGVAGSLAFADTWHVRGEWATGETESNGGRDVDNLELAVGLNRNLTERTDLVIDLFFGSIDEENAGGGSVDSDYLGYSFGVRSMFTDQFELNAAMVYADVDCPAGCGGPTGSAVNIGGEIGGRYLFDEAISVGATFNWNGVQGDLLTVNVRWAFGDIL